MSVACHSPRWMRQPGRTGESGPRQGQSHTAVNQYLVCVVCWVVTITCQNHSAGWFHCHLHMCVSPAVCFSDVAWWSSAGETNNGIRTVLVVQKWQGDKNTLQQLQKLITCFHTCTVAKVMTDVLCIWDPEVHVWWLEAGGRWPHVECKVCMRW